MHCTSRLEQSGSLSALNAEVFFDLLEDSRDPTDTVVPRDDLVALNPDDRRETGNFVVKFNQSITVLNDLIGVARSLEVGLEDISVLG